MNPGGRVPWPRRAVGGEGMREVNAKARRRQDAKEEVNAKAQRRKGAKKTKRGVSENQIARVVVDAAVEVHRVLGGPGLLESVYEEALAHELGLRDLEVSRQVSVPVVYKGTKLATDLRVDLLVEGKVVIECKATSQDNPVFQAQALTYLRVLDLRLALVVNFGQPLVKDGIHRVVNRL